MSAKQIAIDGPAGAGKSTLAKMLAQHFSYLYIDTGAMYRAVALSALSRGISPQDSAALAELMPQLRIALDPDGHVFVNGEDVTEAIRLPEVGNMASAVSTTAAVREALVCQQQEMAASQNVVMDGRDIGTVVLPHADCKIFLTASSQVRAARRAKQLQEKGLPADLEQIRREIEERDYRDSHRENSPLCQAEDAILLDSSELGIEQVLERMISIVEACA
ncbi:MAG: (d)CMP kinase [Bacillota bacterium]|nr:(d)CMP kinase [Bacillota bacterium]